MSAEPWSKFFWSDYDADEGLRMCSLAAQGLWMRMLCLMARATPKGELRVGGEPCTVTDLSRAVGESEEMVAGLLCELERRGVFSTTRAGVIYSRRLRKDAEISRKRAKAGAKGAAATNLKLQRKSDLPQQNSGKASGKRAAPEARSQSSVSNETGGEPPGRDVVRSIFDLGLSLLKAEGMTETGARKLIGSWRKGGNDEAVEAALLDAQSRNISKLAEWMPKRLAGGAKTELDTLFAQAQRYRTAA